MCGIIGYVGKRNAREELIRGLYKLEYRGYDSAGLTLFSEGECPLLTLKRAGRVSELARAVEESELRGSFRMGIAHTRWATHGAPNDRNSHPHSDGHGKLSLVHNGIIENYAPLKEELEARGEVFSSDTDTEVVAKLIGENYDGDPLLAIAKALPCLRGSYALAILFADRCDELYVAKKDSPLLCGIGEGENYVASDITAFAQRTSRYLSLEDMQIARIREKSVEIFDSKLEPISPKELKIDWDLGDTELCGHSCYMEKEIKEQATVARRVLSGLIKNGMPDFSDLQAPVAEIAKCKKLRMIACGTAMHAGLFAKTVFENLARIPVEVSLASEFRYSDPILEKDEFAFVISQSGETADTTAALRLLKERGVPTAAVVNVVGSTIAREASYAFHTCAGPEIAVASTKAYLSQTVLLSHLALAVSYAKFPDKKDIVYKYTSILASLSDGISQVLERAEEAKALAQRIKDERSLFFLGRGKDYPAICEASLKLKEISYIHSEAYAAGELKHGTISLIAPGTQVIALATEPELFEKVGSNLKEVLARGASVHLVTVPEGEELASLVQGATLLPKGYGIFAPLLGVVFAQLLAMYTAQALNRDVDKPRNLAKSVTVE